MNTLYNRIAGQSLERLAALSDGIFAVVMTLLILEIHAPRAESEQDLWNDLGGDVLWNLLPYFMSFLTLGIYWVIQQTQIYYFARSDRNLTWIYLGFLFAVTLMPFSTGLLARNS